MNLMVNKKERGVIGSLFGGGSFYLEARIYNLTPREKQVLLVQSRNRIYPSRFRGQPTLTVRSLMEGVTFCTSSLEEREHFEYRVRQFTGYLKNLVKDKRSGGSVRARNNYYR